MDELLNILESLHPGVDFTTREALVDDRVLKSFDIVAIVSEIYEVFGVVVPPEEIVPENFNSAKALYALIERLEDE